MAMISRTGLTVPSAFDTWAAATTFVRSLTRPANASMSSSPLSWIGRHAEPRPGLPGDDLPRDDVRVVLHGGDDDLVARREPWPRPALRDEVQPFGGAPHEDDLAPVGRVQERPDRVPRPLVGVRRPLAQRMQPPVDVRVVGFVVAADGVDDRARLLARGAVVEVHERCAVHLLREDGKLGADAFHVEHVRGRPRREVGGVAHRSISCSPSAAREVREHRRADGLAELGAGDPIHHVAGEPVGEHAARRALRDAARAQVEQHLLVELPDGGAVRALDVVGVDLELGLGVDLGVARKEQVAVGLMRFGLLRVRVDVDAPVEHPAPASARDALVVLLALAPRRDVLDVGVEVDVLAAVRDVQPVEGATRVLVVERHVDVVPREPGSERHRPGAGTRLPPRASA